MWTQGPMPLMEKAYKSYGSVFTVPLFHKRMTFLIGPEVSSHFFKVCASLPTAARVKNTSAACVGETLPVNESRQERQERGPAVADGIVPEHGQSWALAEGRHNAARRMVCVDWLLVEAV